MYNNDRYTIRKKGLKMKKLTPIGKFLRHLRTDRDEQLSEMAEKLGISKSFLSTVEHGTRPAPQKMINLLATKYELSEHERVELAEAVRQSRVMQYTALLKELPAPLSEHQYIAYMRIVSNVPDLSLQQARIIMNALKDADI